MCSNEKERWILFADVLKTNYEKLLMVLMDLILYAVLFAWKYLY